MSEHTLPDELKTIGKKLFQKFNERIDSNQRQILIDSGIFEETVNIFGFSEFIANTCIRNPIFLIDLAESGDLFRSLSGQDFAYRVRNILLPFENMSDNDIDPLMISLRHIRAREMVRIAWRDLSGRSDFHETTRELSAFADTILDHTLSVLQRRLEKKFGKPTGTSGKTCRMVIIAMGKLGAEELNFSSDIDLIFAFPESGETDSNNRSISNDEFFSKLAGDLIKVLGKQTAEGWLFRMDLGLRPFGDGGPLVRNFDSLSDYYQYHGREWERYAWIKARICAGDNAEGKRLVKELEPFVYRRYLDFGSYEALREMKRMIETEVKRKSLENNIKLGAGGIREIEFFGQVFQLTRGGVLPQLKERKILTVLDILTGEGIIDLKIRDDLKNAYVFLRNTENRLQQFRDRQTHELPDDPADKQRLAVSMGFQNYDHFFQKLDEHKRIVHNIFGSLFDPDKSLYADESVEESFVSLWRNPSDPEAFRNAVFKFGFEEPGDIVSILNTLRTEKQFRALSESGQSRLAHLLPVILKKVRFSNHPVNALGKIVDLIKSIQGRMNYLSMLLEYPDIIDRLIDFSEKSGWILSFLSRYPMLLDELIDTRTLFSPPEKNELEKELRRRMDQIPDEDLESKMEWLRVYKQVNTLRVAAADISNAIPLMRVSDHLSDIAETVLAEVMDISFRHVQGKYGLPVCAVGKKPCDRGYAVIAYGKLGGIELGYASDLDIVFLHAGVPGETTVGENPVENMLFFVRLAQRALHILSAHTAAGKLYDTDTRLRPSGSSGVLVTHIDGFRDYQRENAWIWEKQALIRARAVAGDPLLIDAFEKIRREVLSIEHDGELLKKSVLDMREKMRKELGGSSNGAFDLKQGSGGMVDIEFIVQYLVLREAGKHPELLRWTDNVRLIRSLMDEGIIDDVTAFFLRKAYLSYRSAAHRLNLKEKPALVPRDLFQDLSEYVKDKWMEVFSIQ